MDGLEYDDHGNAIYHISEGCVVVNLLFIGCTLGKAKVHGDLFKDMRLYFDEQRLPPLDEGNGNGERPGSHERRGAAPRCTSPCAPCKDPPS